MEKTIKNHVFRPQDVTSCSVYSKVSFFGLQLASFGAGCAAAFLINRSQSSAHASSAFGYAGINWVQSILAPAGFVQHGCYYGTMAHIYESYGTFNQYRLPLCLVASLWMQVLLVERLVQVERSSHEKCCSKWLRKCIWVQAFGVAAAVLSFAAGEIYSQPAQVHMPQQPIRP